VSIAPQQLELAYSAVSGHYDEMTLPSGELRPHWRELVASLQRLGGEEFLRRWHEGQRLIEENGVTYNVYGDPRGIDRPWQLDPIPLLISSEEWAELEAAVAQRALLLDRILADLYGDRRLLRDALLPAELVYGNPAFQRPCHGVRVPGDCYLHAFAADLARSPNGQWWVISDRTQAPSGAGYALENRIVMSRILPEAFRDIHVQRLAGFFQAYRDTLMQLAPTTGRPRIVLLTPGPYNETYFEHAYLARYLGVTLVEGNDLTVREDRVYLKTLSGLLPVHVILRRQDDAFCDPLELLGESALGTPGLMQAVRAGTVVVANALGSGVLETAATMAFLPGLSRAVLGEELRMPSVATWWCGQPTEREYVIEHLEELVIKPTFPSVRAEVVFGEDLSERERSGLVDRIRANPHGFMAQERVALSTVPTGTGEGAAPRHLVLRVYAVRSGDHYVVMPGGLTRVSPSPDSLVVSSQRGGGSKDTWVLADGPVPYTTLIDRVTRPSDVSRASFALTSRVADNLFWLGRMSERADAGARLFRCALRRLAEEPIRAVDAPLPDAVVLLERMLPGALAPPTPPEADGDAEPEQADRDGEADGDTAPETADPGLESRVLTALFDRARIESVGGAVAALHRIAWLLRDRISPDAWRALVGLEQDFVEPSTHPALRVSEALQLLDGAIARLAAFTGIAMESMTRGLGWQFLDIGRRLERGIQIVSLLRHGLVEPAAGEPRRITNVLEVADSAMTYRSRYQTSLEVPLVLDLLLADDANPRSLAFQLDQLESRFRGLPRAPRRDLADLREHLRSAPLDALVAVVEAPGAPPRRARLDALLATCAAALPALADVLNHAYLVHAVARRRRTAFAALQVSRSEPKASEDQKVGLS
jgi:uncharacterized circularly permuted ATP-grasp superfamily protein/uncharacterized alpha-E superfamily protein